jgi:hypothetical protein
MTRDQACKRLRVLATRAANHDGGRAANRLSAYALLLAEDSVQVESACADLDNLAEQTPNRELAAVLREASRIVRRWP